MKMEQVPQKTWQQQLVQRVNDLLDSDVEWAEIVSIFGGIIWGIVLLLPGNTFATSKAYNLISFWHEDVWAVLFLIFATVQAIGLLSNRLRWRMRCAALGAVVWAFVCSMLVISNPISTAYFYVVPCIGCLWALARLARYKV